MVRTTTQRWITVAAACLGLLADQTAHASLARNAAGARNIGEKGKLTIDTAGQLESGDEGKVWTFEAEVQYQLTRRLQALVEGKPIESQRPHDGESVGGLGDTEATLSWLASPQHARAPSVVLGAKVKLPTARDEELGSGRADYSALFILGHEGDKLELNLETEFATFGQPGGEELKNQFIYSLNSEYSLGDYLAVYAELAGHSAPTALESRADVGKIGMEVDIPWRETIAPYLSAEYDTDSVTGFRAGVEWTW